MGDGDIAVVVSSGDGPCVSVLNELGAGPVGQTTLVATRDDDVAATSTGAITQVNSVGLNLSLVDAVDAGSGV